MLTRVYEKSDYAGLSIGGKGEAQDIDIYYGYEHIFCPNHPEAGVQQSTLCQVSDDDGESCDIDVEWAFCAKENGKVVAAYGKSELQPYVRTDESTMHLVMAGLTKMFIEGKLRF